MKIYRSELEWYETLKDCAARRGGKLLSKSYKGMHENLFYQCKRGHKFKAKPINTFYKNSWCAICAGKAPINMHTIRQYVEALGGTVLSTHYTGENHAMLFKCKNGHSVVMNWRNVRATNFSCKKCRENKTQ